MNSLTTATTTGARTLAQVKEDLRFAGVLADLDPYTAALLLHERLCWRLAESARRQEEAQRDKIDRLLRSMQS